MKIVRFYAENFRRLRCVEVTPDGNIVPIKGKNTHGKTSVLDGIWAVLKWKAASREIKSPINNGAENAMVELDLGDYIVKRTFSEGDEKVTTKLTITKPNGDIVSSPQSILDGLIGSMSFDPMEFARMRDSDKRQAIADLVGLDLAKFDGEVKTATAERRDVKKEVARLSSLLQNMRAPSGDEPTEKTPIADLLSELRQREKFVNRIDQIDRREKEIEMRIANLKLEMSELDGEREKLLSDEKGRDTCFIQQDIDNLEVRNSRAREIQQYFKIKDALKSREEDVRTLTARIELAKIEKEEVVEQADLPIKGLTIEPDSIMINGVDFGSLSQAEKIRHSMAMAMAANPELRVIRISDGSLLDDENMAIIEEMAAKKDFQIWVEMVANEPDGSGIYLEDGRVKND